MGQRFGWALLLAAVLVLSGACTASRPPTPTPTATATPTTPATQAGPAAEITATQAMPDQAVEITATPAPDQAAEGTATPAPDQDAGDENTATPTEQPQDQATGDTAEDAAEQEAFTPTPEVDAEALAQEIQQWYQAHLGQRDEFLLRVFPRHYLELFETEEVTDYWDRKPGAQRRYIPKMVQMVLARIAEKIGAPDLDDQILALMAADPENTFLVYGAREWIMNDRRGRKIMRYAQPAVLLQMDAEGRLVVVDANETGLDYLDEDNTFGSFLHQHFGDTGLPTNVSYFALVHNGTVIWAIRVDSRFNGPWTSWSTLNTQIIGARGLPDYIWEMIPR